MKINLQILKRVLCTTRTHSTTKLFSLLALLLMLGVNGVNGQVSITGFNSGNTYTQDFDAFRGTSGTLPTNWAVSSAIYNATYPVIISGGGTPTVAQASGNNCYAGRAGSSSSDYSILQKQATSGSTTFTLSTTNNTGATINGFVITWNVEQYNSAGRATTVDFAYRLNAGSYVTTGITGTTLFTGTTGSSTTFSVVQTARSITITGLSLAASSTADFRFSITNGSGSGSNAHIGIDDFTLYATQSTSAPTVTNTTPATNIATTSATLAGNVTATGGASITGNGSVYSLTTTNAAPQISGTGVTQLASSSPSAGTGTFSNNISATLSVNAQYSFNAYAINSAGTSYGTVSTFYTLANAPNAPTVNNPTTGSLDVAIGSGDGNPSITEYAIQETGSSNYVQTGGTLSSSAVWQTAATWATKTVTGLAPSTSYTFKVKARNGANAETTFGSTANNTTSASSTPTISGATAATAFTTTYGTASTVQTFSISGVNLTTDITATAPTGFQVSSDGTTYGSTATFTQSGGNASGSLRIRLAATASVLGSYNSVNVVLSSTGATDANITTASTGNSVSTATLTITGLSASDKTYDRTTTVSVSGTAAFSGLMNSESFTPSGSVTWAFADALVGASKPLTRTGTYAAPSANYSVTQPSLTASITALTLTTSGSAAITSKQYDRTTTATVTSISLTNVISGDVVTIAGTYNDKTVNTGKSVTLSLSGADNANYSWTAPTGITGNITSLALTVTSAAVTSKLYDGTTAATITGSLSGIISGDVVTLNGTGTFASAAVGTGISVTSTSTLGGADAGNYTLTQPTGLTGNISIQAPGLLLLEDNFTHSALLTSNGYTATSGTGTNNLTAGATGLTYTNYGSSNIGNALAIANTGQDDSRTFTTQNSATSVYASFLVKVSAALTGDYFFAFAPSSGNTTYKARTFIKASSNSGYFNMGISHVGSSGTYGTTDLAINTTHLIVVKYTFTSATSAVCTIFVNPNTTSGEPSSNEVTVTDNTGANAPADIASFSIRQGTAANAPTFVMDGIRIATNWGSLMGNPQYNSSTNIGAGNYNNVNVLSGTLTATGDITVNGTTTNDGIISIGANTLTLSGAVSGSGTFTGGTTSNLTIGGTAGTVQFTTGSTNNYLKNLTLNASSSMTIGSNALNITGGSSFGVVTVGSGATLASGGHLTLKSTSAGTAAIGNSSGTITGNITVERFISGSGRKWRYLSSPVTGQTLANWGSQFYITGPGTPGETVGSQNSNLYATTRSNLLGFNNIAGTPASVRTYNRTTSGTMENAWANPTTDMSTTLTPGVGYRAFVRGPITGDYATDTVVIGYYNTSGAAPTQASLTLSQTGGVSNGVNAGSVVITINSTGTGTASAFDATNDGWNLIGNPYPCAFDWGAFWTANANRTNIVNSIYIYDVTASSYKSYNGSALSGSLNNGLIPSSTSFFIQASASGAALTFTEAFKSTSAPSALHKNSLSDELHITYYKDSTESDEYILKMMEGATLENDMYDIKKLKNVNLNLSSYGTDSINLTLSSIPLVTDETRISLNVEATQIGTYKFDFNTIETFDNNKSVSLLDKFTGETIDIRKNPIYTFEMDAAPHQWGNDRFVLIFKAISTTGLVDMGANSILKTKVSVYPNPATDLLNVNINNASFKNSSVSIFNISGTELLSSNMVGTSSQFNIESLSSGVYFVKIRNSNGFDKTVKFIK